MKPLFMAIPKEKQGKIIDAATGEFAANHYDQASLNHIIEMSRISKGGFFKYFTSKKDLYLFLVRHHLESVIRFQKEQLTFQEHEILERIRKLASATITFYQTNPTVYRMLLNAFMDQSLSIYQSVMEVRNRVVSESRTDFLAGIDWDQYSISQEDLLKIYNWINLGLNATLQSDMPIEVLIRDFELVLSCLKFGIMKGEKV